MKEVWEIIKESPKLAIFTALIAVIFVFFITFGFIYENQEEKKEQQYKMKIEQRIENLEERLK